MARCGNCSATITCGCQKRTASDGKSCCNNCIANYERKIKAPPPQPPQNSGTTPGITNVTITQN